MAAAVVLAAAAAIAAAQGGGRAAAASCRHVRGPFRVSGNHMITGTGTRFTPYGINLTLLNGSPDVPRMEAETDAAATAWCANLVRVIFRQERADLPDLAQIVGHAEADGLAVVITMDSNVKGSAREPSALTRSLWHQLAGTYGHDPQVIFDLYNEPSGSWSYWHQKMQYLAGRLRHYWGSRNLFWVEGHERATTLAGVPRWHLTHVGPVAYSEHHPPAPHTAASWDHSFGNVARTFPVVEGEWVTYASWSCWADAPVAVPRFLSYLATRHLGLVAYNLAQPRLLESPSLTDPNRIKADWHCAPGVNEGAGHQIMSWLQAHNG